MAATRRSKVATSQRRKPAKPARSAKRVNAARGRVTKAGKRHAAPQVQVVWRQLPLTAAELDEHVRQIAATVLGHMQRPADAPVLALPGLASPQAAQLRPAQSEQPLSYVEGEKRIASVQWSDLEGGVIRAVTEDGEVIELKTGVRANGPGTVGAVDKPLRPRRPMKVHRRPGNGGLRRTRGGSLIDPTEGLDEYGQATWWSVKGGAVVGLLEVNPNGNAVVLCRLSSEEKNDRLIDQLRPCLALAKQHDLEVRTVIMALKMSGKREVRPDRAGPPPDGVLEREDMLELDKYIEAGWVEHIIARGGDRIAREILPAETLLHRWARHGISLWLSDFGRRVDYVNDSADRMLVRAMDMISAEERNSTVLRLQRAALNKGPLAGNGHLGPTPFGFLRDKETRRLYEDSEQWPWILRTFELADLGTYLDGNGLSARQLAAQLAEEGCPFDHDRVRTILKDTIYATGEYVTHVRSIPIPQTPVQLKNPVPIDRFQRVQDLLALRKGRSNLTPLGEFLFNYVETYHFQCIGMTSKRGPAIVKGYIASHQREELRNYRHGYWVPECCQSGGRGHRGKFTWDRDILERPVVEEIRKLATHPELLRQLQIAARHTVADSSARLTKPQRSKIEQEIVELEQRQEQAIDAWIERTSEGSHDLAGYHQLMSKFEQKMQTLKRRLEMDDKARQAEALDATPKHKQRVNAFLEIMTLETPDDPFLRQLRARLFQQIVSRIIVDDSGEGPITLIVEGHLVPEGAPLDAGNPILASEELLDAYIARKSGKTPTAESILEEVAQVETDLSVLADKSVSICALTVGQALTLPSTETVQLAIRRSLESQAWRYRVEHALRAGEPSWTTTLKLETYPAYTRPRRHS